MDERAKHTMSASGRGLMPFGLRSAVQTWVTFLSSLFLSTFGRTRDPMKMIASTKSTASMATTATWKMSRLPPPAMPTTMARTIMPNMSSMTAAPIMTRDSTVCMRFMSLMTRAVMPTLVATMDAPTNRASSCFSGPRAPIIRRYPTMNGRMTPNTATNMAVLPTLRMALNGVSRPTEKRRNITPSSLRTSKTSRSEPRLMKS